MLPERHVKLIRNGANQVLLIPSEFELAGNEAILKKDGDRLIIEAVKPHDLLATWDLLEDDFPDADSGLLPLDDIAL